MRADTVCRRHVVFNALTVHDFADDQRIETMAGVWRSCTKIIGIPAAGGRTCFRRPRAAAPRLDRDEGANGQHLFGDEIDAVFAGILHKTEIASGLIQKPKTNDGFFL